MKIGISSPAFAFEPFQDTLEKVSSEFKLWEIFADLNNLLPDIYNEIKQAIPSYDIEFSIHAPFNDLNIASLNPFIRNTALNYLKDTIKYIDMLGIDLLTLHPGHQSPTGIYYPKKVKEINLRSIRMLAEFAKDYSITLALENMPIKSWTLGNTAEEILEMIDGSKIGICFDIGHAFIQNQINNFLDNIDRIFNIHIHDNNGRRDEHLVLGDGEIDITYIINRLSNNYKGNIIIECNNLEEGARSKRYLEHILRI